MKNIRNRKQTCLAPPAQDEWWALESFLFSFFSFFSSSLLTSWWMSSSLRDQNNDSLSHSFFFFFFFFFFFPSTCLSFHLWFLTSPLWPASMNVDRDRHMQGGQQPCLASGSSPWQQISMRTDNGTRNENNAVCQPRNSACHSGPFPMLGVFHELRWTRKLHFKCSSVFFFFFFFALTRIYNPKIK